MFLQGQCLVFASECMLVLVARRDQHNLWEQGSLSICTGRSSNIGCELQTCPRFFKKCFVPMLFECSLNVVSGDNIQTTLAASCKHIQDCPQKFFLANVVLSECCLNVLWRQHSDNFGRELQTYPRFSTNKKFLENVVWMLSLETTLRQHSGKRIVFRLFWLEINVFGLWKRSKTLILSECCLWRQHWDNIETTFGQKKCFSPFFGLEISVFGLWKRSKTLILSECCLWRQHSDNIH